MHTRLISSSISILKQIQRARGASYRLLKHKINNYYMYTLYAKKTKIKMKKNFNVGDLCGFQLFNCGCELPVNTCSCHMTVYCLYCVLSNVCSYCHLTHGSLVVPRAVVSIL